MGEGRETDKDGHRLREREKAREGDSEEKPRKSYSEKGRDGGEKERISE